MIGAAGAAAVVVGATGAAASAPRVGQAGTAGLALRPGVTYTKLKLLLVNLGGNMSNMEAVIQGAEKTGVHVVVAMEAGPPGDPQVPSPPWASWVQHGFHSEAKPGVAIMVGHRIGVVQVAREWDCEAAPGLALQLTLHAHTEPIRLCAVNLRPRSTAVGSCGTEWSPGVPGCRCFLNHTRQAIREVGAYTETHHPAGKTLVLGALPAPRSSAAYTELCNTWRVSSHSGVPLVPSDSTTAGGAGGSATCGPLPEPAAPKLRLLGDVPAAPANEASPLQVYGSLSGRLRSASTTTIPQARRGSHADPAVMVECNFTDHDPLAQAAATQVEVDDTKPASLGAAPRVVRANVLSPAARLATSQLPERRKPKEASSRHGAVRQFIQNELMRRIGNNADRLQKRRVRPIRSGSVVVQHDLAVVPRDAPPQQPGRTAQASVCDTQVASPSLPAGPVTEEDTSMSKVDTSRTAPSLVTALAGAASGAKSDAAQAIAQAVLLTAPRAAGGGALGAASQDAAALATRVADSDLGQDSGGRGSDPTHPVAATGAPGLAVVPCAGATGQAPAVAATDGSPTPGQSRGHPGKDARPTATGRRRRRDAPCSPPMGLPQSDGMGDAEGYSTKPLASPLARPAGGIRRQAAAAEDPAARDRKRTRGGAAPSSDGEGAATAAVTPTAGGAGGSQAGFDVPVAPDAASTQPQREAEDSTSKGPFPTASHVHAARCVLQEHEPFLAMAAPTVGCTRKHHQPCHWYPTKVLGKPFLVTRRPRRPRMVPTSRTTYRGGVQPGWRGRGWRSQDAWHPWVADRQRLNDAAHGVWTAQHSGARQHAPHRGSVAPPMGHGTPGGSGQKPAQPASQTGTVPTASDTAGSGGVLGRESPDDGGPTADDAAGQPVGCGGIKVFSANMGAGGWAGSISAVMLRGLDLGADIIVCQETHLKPGTAAVLPAGLWPHARVLQSSRPQRDPTRAWGGVALVVSMGPSSKVAEVTLVDECTTSDVLWVRLVLKGVTKPLFVAPVYLPPPSMPSVCVSDGACVNTKCGHNHPEQGALYVAATLPDRASAGSILLLGDINADSTPVGPAYPQSPQQARFLRNCVRMWGVQATAQEAQGGEQFFPLGTALACLNREQGPLPGVPVPTFTSAGGRLRAYDNAFTSVGAGNLLRAALQVVDMSDLGLDHSALLVTLHFTPTPRAAPREGSLAKPRTGVSGGAAVPGGAARTQTHMRSFTSSTLLQGVPLTDAQRLSLAARCVEWMEVQVPCMPQEEWYRGLCDVLNSTVESERGATGMGEAPGPSSAALTAERLKEAMHGASRAHRAWVVSCNRERHKVGFDNTRAQEAQASLFAAYRAAQRAFRKASRQAVAAVHDGVEAAYLAAVASNDPKAVHAAVRAAFPSDKAGSPHPLARLATVMDVRAGATAADVLPEAEREGMSRAEIGREAAQRHADALAPVFTELGTSDPQLSSAYLLQQRRVLEAAAQARRQELDCRARGEPSHQGPWSGPVTAAEVEEVLKASKLAPATLGTASAALVAAGVGPEEAHVQFRTHLATRLSSALALGLPAVDDCMVVLTPLYKGGGADPADPLSYRDIAVVGALPKVLIQVIRKRLEASPAVMAAVDPLQAGFQRGRSTMEHVLLADLLRAQRARRGTPAATAFVDIRRAYPSVNHELLLAALWELGVEGDVFEYLKQWLTGQHMYVRVDGQFSDRIKAGLGLPEGSCLSCLLFLIYFSYVMKAVNAVPHPDAGIPVAVRNRDGSTNMLSIRIPCFADDASVWGVSTQGEQALMDALGAAFADLRLRANIGPAKTAWFQLLQPPGYPEHQLFLPPHAVSGPPGTAPVPVTVATSYKHLGVVIDAGGNNVHASHHARAVATSHRAAHNMATSHVTALPPLVAGRAYNSLVLQSITYGIGVWGAHHVPATLLRNERNMAAMLVRSAVLPMRAAHAVAGVKSLAHSQRSGVLSSALLGCRQGRQGALRAVVARDALDWCNADNDHTREGIWLASVLWVLQTIDEALAWNDVEEHCPHGTDPALSRPLGVLREPYPDSGPREWRQTVCDTLLHWHRDTTWVDEATEGRRVQALESHKAAALRVVTLRERTRALWQLPSTVGVASLSCRVDAPPFASLRRSPGNQLRVLVRGGLRCLLGWPTYTALRELAQSRGPLHVGGGLGPGATPVPGYPEAVGDSVAYMPCPLCTSGGGCTLRHLVQECAGLADVRSTGREEAQRIMWAHGVQGDLADSPHTCPDLQLDWWLLTVGAEVPTASWHLQGARRLAKEPAYGPVLGATGKLLVAVVARLAAVVKAADGEATDPEERESGDDSEGFGAGAWCSEGDSGDGEGEGSGASLQDEQAGEQHQAPPSSASESPYPRADAKRVPASPLGHEDLSSNPGLRQGGAASVALHGAAGPAPSESSTKVTTGGQARQSLVDLGWHVPTVPIGPRQPPSAPPAHVMLVMPRHAGCWGRGCLATGPGAPNGRAKPKGRPDNAVGSLQRRLGAPTQGALTWEGPAAARGRPGCTMEPNALHIKCSSPFHWGLGACGAAPPVKGAPGVASSKTAPGAFESQRFHSTTVARQCCGRAPPCCRTWTTGPHVKLTCRSGGDRDTAGTVWPPNPLRAWTEVLGGVGTTLWRHRPP